MPENEKPKCPECETELVLVEGKLPKTCGKCNFHLAGFAGFERWMKAYEKNKAATAPKPKVKTDEEKSPLDFISEM